MSHYTWLEEFTEEEYLVGGYCDDGKPYTTLSGLNDQLKDHFELLEAPKDILFVICETARKYQHSIAQMSIWKKK